MHLVAKKQSLIQVYHTAIFFSLSVLQAIPHTEQFTQRKLKPEGTKVLCSFLLILSSNPSVLKIQIPFVFQDVQDTRQTLIQIQKHLHSFHIKDTPISYKLRQRHPTLKCSLAFS